MSKSILSRLTLIGLLATIAVVAAGCLLAAAAGAAQFEVFPSVTCTPEQVAINQSTTCTGQVNHVANPDEHLPSGQLTFKDSRNTGTFNPGTCTLTRLTSFTSACSVTFSSASAGGRTISIEYPGDGFNNPGSASTHLKVFIPNAVRFAAPGGTGADPCTNKASPCSLFTAASRRAPDTSIVPGAEVVLAPGTYTNADLGGFPELSLERGITFRGEAGSPRPLLSFQTGQLSTNNSFVSHIEISTGGGEALLGQGGVVDEVVARASGAGGVTCTMESGVLRDSVCLSSGFGSGAAGLSEFAEFGETFESKLRNVTAISTGSESVGLSYVIDSVGAKSGTINVSASSVIAKGARLDVSAKGFSEGGFPSGVVNVVLDHSDYARTGVTGTGSITAPGTNSNIIEAPLLAADNIHQLFNSPTIDKGFTDGSSGVIDIDGEARKQGPAVDIGADEVTPPNSTTTKLTCKGASLITGETTKCTATVTDNADHNPVSPITGTVAFSDKTEAGTISPATCTLAAISSTQASCQTEVDFKPITIASHALEAIYSGDGGKHSASTGTLSLEVKPKPNTTTTKLTCKAANLITGETTKCTATVTDNADQNPVSPVTGTVSFKDNTEPTAITSACSLVTISSNQASCQTEVDFKPTQIASHALEASYSGDGGKHAPSTGTLSFEVKPKPNTTTTKLSCKAPSLVTGESTKCTATVTDNAEPNPVSPITGSVVFSDRTEAGTITPATCTLEAISTNQASCKTEVDFKPTKVASHALEASYSGDGGKHAISTGTLSFNVNEPNTTRTELSCKASTLFSGESTTCTAKVTDEGDHNLATTPTGTVSFKDNNEENTFSPASCVLTKLNNTQAACSTEVGFSPTKAVVHQLEAKYTGDAKHAPSPPGALSFEVKPKLNATETKLSCKASTLFSGESTKCTATVTDEGDNNLPTSPTGTVSFKDTTEEGTLTPATCTLAKLNNVQAVCSTEVDFKPIKAASHALEATYSGDGGKHAISSGTLSFEVKPGNATRTELSCKAATLFSEENTKCTAKVTDEGNPNLPTSPTGTVSFKDTTDEGAFLVTTCGLVKLNNTQSVCALEVDFKPIKTGNHQLEAKYTGDASHATSFEAQTFPVKPRLNTTETELSCKASTLFSEESTTCTAKVTDEGDHNLPTFPAGTVSFKDTIEEGAFATTTCTLVKLNNTQSVCGVEVGFKPAKVAVHGLEAHYSGGDGAHATSFRQLSVQVLHQPNGTKTELTCKASTLFSGESTHCTATVFDTGGQGTPAPPAGQVSFKDTTEEGTFSPVTCQLQSSGAFQSSCIAEVEFEPNKVGPHALEARYPGGDGAHAPSFVPLSVMVKPKPNLTRTELSCKASTLFSEESTTCTAKVTDEGDPNLPTFPTGTVSFKDTTEEGAFPTTTCALVKLNNTQSACTAEVEFKPTKAVIHQLEAKYSGDPTHATSFGTLSFEVRQIPNTTRTELSCKASTLFSRESTTCTAKVTDEGDHNLPSSPAGTVSFKDGAEEDTFPTPSCTLAKLNNSQAVCTAEVEFKPTRAEMHELEAKFSGDVKHTASPGTLSFEVKAVPPPPVDPTKTTLVCTPTILVLGAGASQCTATVEDTSGAGASHPSGEVKLDVLTGEGALAAKSCTLPENGQSKASCQVIAYTPAKTGDNELRATYQGDATHAKSSGTVKLTVNAPPPPPPPPPTAPNTTLSKKPNKKTAARLALFRFSSDQAGSTFQCKVDKKPAKPCGSPFKAKVGPGRHTFTVGAVNAQGVADPTPVVFHWTVGPVKKRPKH